MTTRRIAPVSLAAPVDATRVTVAGTGTDETPTEPPADSTSRPATSDGAR